MFVEYLKLISRGFIWKFNNKFYDFVQFLLAPFEFTFKDRLSNLIYIITRDRYSIIKAYSIPFFVRSYSAKMCAKKGLTREEVTGFSSFFQQSAGLRMLFSYYRPSTGFESVGMQYANTTDHIINLHI